MLRVLVALFCAAVPLAVADAASINPLDEHRAARSARHPAFVVQTTVRGVDEHDRVSLDLPSARLVAAGARSGDRVTMDVGARTVFAFIAFRDELEREALQPVEAQAPRLPGMTLVVDRERSNQRVVLDASSGGIASGEVHRGQEVTITAVRRVRRQGD